MAERLRGPTWSGSQWDCVKTLGSQMWQYGSACIWKSSCSSGSFPAEKLPDRQPRPPSLYSVEALLWLSTECASALSDDGWRRLAPTPPEGCPTNSLELSFVSEGKWAHTPGQPACAHTLPEYHCCFCTRPHPDRRKETGHLPCSGVFHTFVLVHYHMVFSKRFLWGRSASS